MNFKGFACGENSHLQITQIYVQLVAHTAETCLIPDQSNSTISEGPKGSHRESAGQSAPEGAGSRCDSPG